MPWFTNTSPRRMSVPLQSSDRIEARTMICPTRVADGRTSVQAERLGRTTGEGAHPRARRTRCRARARRSYPPRPLRSSTSVEYSSPQVVARGRGQDLTSTLGIARLRGGGTEDHARCRGGCAAGDRAGRRASLRRVSGQGEKKSARAGTMVSMRRAPARGFLGGTALQQMSFLSIPASCIGEDPYPGPGPGPGHPNLPAGIPVANTTPHTYLTSR
jgi:hypothetical protein